MKASLLCLILGLVLCREEAQAVENGSNSTLNTTAPTSSDIPNWDTGWTQPAGQTGVTGWNYVGTVAGGGGTASGVYLGNNWVLTAGHVGTGTFTLGGTAYSVVPGSARSISNSNGTADICLFQITPAPNLPALNIATLGPSVGDSVAMLGYGDRGSITHETWGLNKVTQVNELITPSGYSYVSTDFETAYGVDSNEYYLVLGDSGGGDFVYNSPNGPWQLTGINEAVGSNNPPDSYFVELSTYATQIDAIVSPQGVPAMPAWGWVVLPVLILLVVSGYLPKNRIRS